jgi:FkbM family methyltransferase
MSIKRNPLTKAALWQFVAAHRDNIAARGLAKVSQGYLNAWLNRANYHIALNGEARVLEIVGHDRSGDVIDAGSNVGEWATLALDAFPKSIVHAFEPVSSTAEILDRVAARSANRLVVQRLGLGDCAGTAQVSIPYPGSGLSSIVGRFPSAGTETIPLTTIDEYCQARRINELHMLKIDTEGYDHRVLEGAKSLLTNGRVDIIQFEYGAYALDTRFLLKDFYDLLASLGYKTGKIHPNSVDFRPYDASMEDFEGLTYLAVRRDRTSLIKNLS